jgi:hypothetical protein
MLPGIELDISHYRYKLVCFDHAVQSGKSVPFLMLNADYILYNFANEPAKHNL